MEAARKRRADSVQVRATTMTILVVASIVAVAEAWFAQGSSSTGLWVLSIATMLLALLMVPAVRLNRRGDPERAVALTCIAILGIQSVYVVVYPGAYPAVTLASVVIVALALGFVHGRRLLALPTSADEAILLSTGLAALTVVMVLMWQFARNLTGALQEARQANAQLSTAHERLKGLDRMKVQFINTAAHELRTPLMPLRTQVHLMQHNPASPPSTVQQKSLAVMKRNLDRLAVLVEDLLTVARSEAGRIDIQRAPIDLAALMAEADESFRTVARERGVVLDVPKHAAALVQADGRRIAQVLANLLSNALKFTPRAGHVAVELVDTGTDLRVTVTDTGAGIDAADLPRLFSPFVQVHDTAQVTDPGSGLGLYICKQFIDMHGGAIGVDSPGRGKGTTVWFTLPKADAPTEAPAPPVRMPAFPDPPELMHVA
jgi:signal transduction histidine kinase